MQLVPINIQMIGGVKVIDEKLKEVLTTPPDAPLAIVTQGLMGPHVVNSWNSYVWLPLRKNYTSLLGVCRQQKRIYPGKTG